MVGELFELWLVSLSNHGSQIQFNTFTLLIAGESAHPLIGLRAPTLDPGWLY